VIDAVTVSVAVIVCEPVVLSGAEKVPVPLLSVLLAGRVAALTAEKCTVPAPPSPCC
jgi:hypothetical protein